MTEGLYVAAAYVVIPSQCSHWRGNPFPAPAGAESPCLPHPAVIIPYIPPNFFAKNLEIH